MLTDTHFGIFDEVRRKRRRFAFQSFTNRRKELKDLRTVHHQEKSNHWMQSSLIIVIRHRELCRF